MGARWAPRLVHRMRASLRRRLQSCDPCPFDRIDLFSHQGKPRQVPTELVQSIDWDRRTLWRPQGVEALRRLSKLGFEAADAEARESTFHPVDNAGALADQVFTLAVWPLCVLFFNAWDSNHTAMTALTTQPADEHAHQKRPAKHPKGSPVK